MIHPKLIQHTQKTREVIQECLIQLKKLDENLALQVDAAVKGRVLGLSLYDAKDYSGRIQRIGDTLGQAGLQLYAAAESAEADYEKMQADQS